MGSIVIKSERSEDLELLKKMAQRMKLDVVYLSEEVAEDLFLVAEMDKVDKSKTVTLEALYKELER